MRSNLLNLSPRSAIGVLLALAVLSGTESTPALQQAAAHARIFAAAVDSLDAQTYRLTFTAAEDAGRIAIYASSSPLRHESTAPVSVTVSSPVIVSAPGSARVYFHLEPAVGPARVVSVRRVPLEGASNFRDLGGYRTKDGRFVKWGMLYRSDHLVGLTASDYRYLDQLGIRMVCDLRTPSERAKSPTRWQGNEPEIMSVSVLTDEELKAATTQLSQEEFQRRLADAAAGVRPPSFSYDRFVLKYADSYSRIFDRLIRGAIPALTHCSAGRDRTGVYSAMILTALGVPWSIVKEDYLLTNKYWLTDSMIEERRRATQIQYSLPTLPDAAAVRALYTLDGSMLEGTFATIRREHGSFDAFRRAVLNVSDAELETLRARFLEP